MFKLKKGMQNVSFKSRIVFTSPLKFSDLYEEHMNEKNCADEPWDIYSTRCGDKWVGTAGINTCTAAFLGTEDKTFAAHLCTDDINFQTLPIYIKALLGDHFKDKKCRTALLIGSKPPDVRVIGEEQGMFIGLKNFYSNKSQKLFKMFKKSVKGLDPTYFRGHADSNVGSDIVYNHETDTYFVNTFKDVYKRGSYVKNAEDLKSVFKEIHVSKRDTVEFDVD